MDKPADMLDGGDQITKARHLMDQLDLKGEAPFQCAPKAGVFAFVAMRPDERTFVNVNLETKVAKVTHIEGNFDQMLGNLLNSVYRSCKCPMTFHCETRILFI